VSLSDGHGGEGATDFFDDRIGEVDASLSKNVEDLRSRILQLKEEVHSRAPAEHDHPQIGTVLDRAQNLAADIESVESDLEEATSELEALTVELDSTDDRLRTVETKLDRLARAVLELKRRSDETADSADALAHLRRVANRHETTAADCGDCGERLQIGLLTEASCPHCGYEFREIEYPSSFLRRFKTPTLTDSDPVSTEADDA
jgi:chromosome segregation ATPase